MGKPNEGSNLTGNQEGEEVQESSSLCNACASSICTGKTLKCVVALVLSLNLLAFGVWSLPFFGKHNGVSGGPASARNLQAQIQASFILEEPISLVNASIPKLEFAIWEEFTVPSTKVAVTSLEPLNATNSTEVIFDILPDPENTYISPYGLFLLRETLINLVSGIYNLSLKSGDFGDVQFFELLKFPGGITVVPEQRVFPLQQVSMLFNFTLHSTIAQVVQNLAQLKKQLSIGLHVRPDENVLVQLTNLQGSTVNPPIIVETFIVPVVGMKGLPTPRLRQLAHEINPSRNLGLNHTLFGKVKQIQLSSYLSYPSSPPPYHLPSPAPSPSPHTCTSHNSPLSSHPYTSPTHSTPPSYDQRVGAPSPHNTVLAPVSHHHAKSPHYHHGKPPYYHHVIAPSSHHPHVHCGRHRALDPVKCRHAGHAPISGLNGEAASPSPDIARPSRHHHRTAASAPRVMTSVPPALSPQNGLSPKAWYWGNPSHPFPLASPAPSRLPHHSAPKSAPPASSSMGSSPKSSHFSPKASPHSPAPQKTRMSHPYLPEKISPAPAFSYVSSSSYAPNPSQLIIGSLILVGIVSSLWA